MGFVTSGPPLSFVGNQAFFSTPSPDTTLVLISVSFPNHGLAFFHEKRGYEAIYGVTLILKMDGKDISRTDDIDTVRVDALNETNRTDESVLFRRTLRLSPGVYSVTYLIRDGTVGHSATENGELIVPRFSKTSITRPLIVYDASPRIRLTDIPQYVPKPRAALIFGIDRTVNVYLESYGTSITTPVVLALRNSEDSTIWSDTTWLAQQREFAAGVVSIPLARADVGILMLSAVRPGATDTLWTPIFIRFNPGLPQLSFEEMVSHLRFFTTLDWLYRLRKAAPENRSSIWTAFLKATDSISGTSQNERLLDYFERVRFADTQFRSDTPLKQGWLSDRGSVFVGLGEPDDIYEQDGYVKQFSLVPGSHTRLLIWEYHAFRARIIFYDETGKGQWRLLPSSATVFSTLLASKLIG
jgi:GWxTD domain-containing protein